MIAPADRPRLRVYAAMDGEELHMLDTSYFFPRPFKHVSPSTTIKDVFSACCETLQWPCEWMMLSIGENTYQWSEQQHLDILVMTLIPSSGSQQLCDVSYDFTYLRRVPDNFQAPEAQGFCLCHFGCVDYALFPTMNHAGAVETMDAAAVWTVAALAARLPKVLIQSDDAHLWVVDRGGPMMMG